MASNEDSNAVKAGARNNVTDQRWLQMIHNQAARANAALVECQELLRQIKWMSVEMGAAEAAEGGAYMAGKSGEGLASGYAMGGLYSIKAVGDWLVDITAAPYGTDGDRQTFDSRTDFMLGTFASPAILYHHGVMPGKKELQDKPVVIGKATRVYMAADGPHIVALLDKASEFARRVWEAAKKGLAVASSDSIAHLARLEVGGKLVMYSKNQPGRIAVWPLAGVSLWDKVEGNFNPASRYALALPAVKAIYREAGIAFPDIQETTTGGSTEAANAASGRAGRTDQIQQEAREILARLKEN